MAPVSTEPECPPTTTHRELFATKYHALPQDVRAVAAGIVSDPDLSALCFDPVPAVIRSILDNPLAGLGHARLVAAHHANPIGLQAVAGRSSFAQDREVQRLLLRNNQTPETVVRSLFSSRPLTEVFRFTQSHDFPQRHRETARVTVKRRFSTAAPEERVELIFATEGRAISALPNLVLDGPTVVLLCARGPFPMLLIENLARWPGTPPKLIAHLLKQAAVGQSPSLKQSLLRHPNYRPM